MMGQQLRDPLHVEGDIEVLPGLGLLPVVTELQGEKVTRQVKFQLREGSEWMEGYEIHMGATIPVEGEEVLSLNLLEGGGSDGVWGNRKCMGTYIHGILDNPAFIDFLLEPHREKWISIGIEFNYQQFKEQQYDKLAAHVRAHVNMPLLYEILTRE